LVSHPGTRATLRFLDDGLRQRAEESLDVGFACQQIERVLDDVSLHLRVAFRAAARRCLAQQRCTQYLGIIRIDFGGTRRPLFGAC
jgi:hypothetical protein